LKIARSNISLENWVDDLTAKGKFSFSLGAVRERFRDLTPVAIKYSLMRLAAKGNILSIHKGYYLIIPPQYRSRGILPPALYLDAFMKELKRPYYLALLNAAVYHGASHQQPQEFFVVTCFPVLRPTSKKGLKVNYISKKEIPASLLEVRKTESGYLNISNAALTATDLIQYEKRVGGITRATEVLAELCDAIKPEAFSAVLIENVPVATLQRLGYLLDKVLHNFSLADALKNAMDKEQLVLFRTPLKAAVPVKGFSVDERWKVIVNAKIELDD
jgi:predicted transcriptional regulator of viral defense system